MRENNDYIVNDNSNEEIEIYYIIINYVVIVLSH